MKKEYFFYEQNEEKTAQKEILRRILNLKYIDEIRPSPTEKTLFLGYYRELIENEFAKTKENGEKISLQKLIKLTKFHNYLTSDQVLEPEQLNFHPFTELKELVNYEPLNIDLLSLDDYLFFLEYAFTSETPNSSTKDQFYQNIAPKILKRFMTEYPFFNKLKIQQVEKTFLLISEKIFNYVVPAMKIPNETILIVFLLNLSPMQDPERAQVRLSKWYRDYIKYNPTQRSKSELDFSSVAIGGLKHTSRIINQNRWALYRMINFRPIISGRQTTSDQSMTRDLRGSSGFATLALMNLVMKIIKSEKLKRKVIYDFLLTDPEKGKRWAMWLSKQNLSLIEPVVLNILKDFKLCSHLLENREFSSSESISLDDPESVDSCIECGLLAKKFKGKNFSRRLKLRQRKNLKGKLYSCHSLFEKELKSKQNVIGLDQNWKLALDLDFPASRSNVNVVFTKKRAEFMIFQSYSMVREANKPLVDVFALGVTKGFNNIYKKEIKSMILLCYRLNSDVKHLKFFHSRNKKVLKSLIVLNSSNATNLEVNRAEGDLIYNGSKLIFLLNKNTFIDILSEEENKFQNVSHSVQRMILDEDLSQGLDTRSPSYKAFKKDMKEFIFCVLYSYESTKRVFRSKIKDYKAYIISMQWFSLLLRSKNSQKTILFVSDKTLPYKRGLIFELKFSEIENGAKFDGFHLLYNKMIVYFDNGYEYELEFQALEDEVAKRIEKVKKHRERSRASREEKRRMIEEYQAKIEKLNLDVGFIEGGDLNLDPTKLGKRKVEKKGFRDSYK